MLGRREAKHIVHGYGFPRLSRSRHKSVQALLLNGWLGDGIGSDGIGSVISDIFSNSVSKFWPKKLFLQYFQCLRNTKVYSNPTLM